MDPRQLKRKADDEHQNGQEDPGEGPSSGSPPAPGPSPPKMPRREDKDIEKEAVDFLEKLLANETEVVLSLGDPLLNLSSVPDDVAMQSFEEILIDHPGDVIQQVQNVGGGGNDDNDDDILAEAVNQAGIDQTSACMTITTPTFTTTAPGTPQGVSTQPQTLPNVATVSPPETSSTERKKSRKANHPTKIIIKPPLPPTCMLPASEIKTEPGEDCLQAKSKHKSSRKPTSPSGFIVISDSEDEEEHQVSQEFSSQPGVKLTMTTQSTGSLGQMSVESSSSSSSSDSECCDECGGGSSPSTLASPVSPLPPTPPPPVVMPSTSSGITSGAKKPKIPKTKSTKRMTSLDCEKVRSAMKEKAGIVFTTPTVETKRGRVKANEVSRMFRATSRSLEYKNLPFTLTNVHQVLSETVNICKSMQVNNRGIMLIYTRTHEVKEAVDQARVKLGRICNLAISTPFLMEHTMPHVHDAEATRKTAEACQQGLRAAWDVKTVHTNELCPRSSDYRTVVVHAATPVDFLGAIQTLIPLNQQFPKQVAIRIFSGENTNSFMLPIYDNASKMYAVGQFDEPKDEELETLSMAIEKAINDMNQESQ
ncbi:Ba156 [Baboon cytomegalovirus]|nr:Ba156 [Baboon cytomegalovirus]